MIGQVLGNRYEILEKIGEGGMAEVYKAKCRLLNRFVAVKMLKPEYSHDTDFVEKFKLEATASAILSSNNIVGIYDVGSEGDINYIVMELVTGSTLKELIQKKGYLNIDETLHVAIQIGRAIDCAHKNGIIHRDIKPQNILVTNDGVIKVTDFGIAKAVNSATITNTTRVLGSAHYFSPEQAKGSILDGRTDIYSLGIVIYEMLTGRVPYEAESAITVALKHIQEEAIPPMKVNISIPKSINDLVLKAISKEPLRRYQSMKEMISDMMDIKNNKAVTIDLYNGNDDDYTREMKAINPEELKKYSNVTNSKNGSRDNSKFKQSSYDDDNYDNYDIDDIDDENISKGKKNSKKQNIILATGITIASIVIIVLGIFIFKMVNGSKNEEVVIPSIIGLNKYDAQEKIESYGLKFYIDSEEESIKPKDEVINCNPREGEKVEKDTAIRVKISKGQDVSVVMKNFKNNSLDDAKSQIRNMDLELGEVNYEYSEDVDKDYVISQSPIDGTRVEPKTKVNLVVSKGKEIKKVTMINVVDSKIEYAKSNIVAIGLEVGVITEEFSDKVAKDNVIKQSIAAGEGAEPKTKVNLVISKGIKKVKVPDLKVKVPDLKGKTLEDAKSNIVAFGLEVGNIKEENDDNVVKDKVISQKPSAGTKVDPNTKVELVVSLGNKNE